MVKTISALEVMLLKMQACLLRASIQKSVDVCVLVVCFYKPPQMQRPQDTASSLSCGTVVGCPSVDRLGWTVHHGGSLAPAVRWWLQLGSPQAVSPDIKDGARMVITWEIGWGCGLELQVSHSLETRFIVVVCVPKRQPHQRPRWKLTPEPGTPCSAFCWSEQSVASPGSEGEA